MKKIQFFVQNLKKTKKIRHADTNISPFYFCSIFYIDTVQEPIHNVKEKKKKQKQKRKKKKKKKTRKHDNGRP